MGQAIAFVQRMDSSFRMGWPGRIAVSAGDRIRAAETGLMDAEELAVYVRGALPGMAPGSKSGRAVGNKGTGYERFSPGGSMSYLKNVGIALDQLAGAMFLGNAPDETISAWAYRTNKFRLIRVIDFIFRDKLHCFDSYLSEMVRAQLPEEYRK